MSNKVRVSKHSGRRSILLTTVMAVALLIIPAGIVWAGEEILQVQQALIQKGYDPGAADGLMGPRTRAAIREFQRAEGLSVTGSLNRETARALGLETTRAVLPSGTTIHVRLDDALDSGEAEVGDEFSLTVSRAITTDVGEVIPVGTRIRGKVTEVVRAARPQRAGKLVLEPVSLSVRGETITIDGRITADEAQLEGEGSVKEDLKTIGIGAGIGAAIGGILKGGKGALAGLIIGGGGTFLGTKGEQVKLPVETPLLVELEESLSVRVIE